MRDRTLWTFHVLAGLVILVLLAMHMAIMHLSPSLGLHTIAGTSPVDWRNVLARMKDVSFAVAYVVLLGTALYHGLYGLRNILLELNPGKGVRAAISYGLLLLGIGLFAFGTYVAVSAPAVGG
jgi:succinate dehydrogenase hydrophobic anchor subunit